MSPPDDVEELGAANPPAEDAEQLKAKIERIQNTSARLAQVYFAAETASAPKMPAPFDLGPLYAAASKATGLSVDELKAASAAEAAANQNAYPEEVPRPTIDAYRLARRRMKSASVPERFIRAVGDKTPIDCHALTRVKQLAAAESGIVILSGGIGTRKTGSACWLLSQVDGGEYLDGHELLAIAFDDRARYLRIAHAPVVVLDEIKLELLDDKGHWRRVFNDLLNTWYARCARVVMTCNLAMQQFKQLADDRSVSRLRECGDLFFVEGADVRGHEGEQS